MDNKTMTTPKQTVEAKVWPPFSDESAKKAVSHLRSTLAPSPNEAPKGEAEEHIFCDCPIHKGSICIIHNHYCKKSAPDKEWEKKFDKDFWDSFSVGGQTHYLNRIKTFIRQLLKAKDQEADRRVSEAIGEIEKEVDKKIRVCSVEQNDEDDYCSDIPWNNALREVLDLLKKKLSPQKGGKK